jgi:hypothetical protein
MLLQGVEKRTSLDGSPRSELDRVQLSTGYQEVKSSMALFPSRLGGMENGKLFKQRECLGQTPTQIILRGVSFQPLASTFKTSQSRPVDHPYPPRSHQTPPALSSYPHPHRQSTAGHKQSSSRTSAHHTSHTHAPRPAHLLGLSLTSCNALVCASGCGL